MFQALVTPSWNCANHNAKKDTLNWPWTPQNSFNLSPKSSLKWKMSGNEYKSPTILFGSFPPPTLSCFLQSLHTRAHTYFVATQLYLTPLAPPSLPVYPPHPDSPVCLFTQCALSQTAVGQKHPVSRERDREEKLIALGEQQPGDTEHWVLKPVITFFHPWRTLS